MRIKSITSVTGIPIASDQRNKKSWMIPIKERTQW